MIIWCNKPELTIISDKEPQTAVLKPLPSDSFFEREAKKEKPYLNKLEVTFTVNYLGTVYVIDIPRGYTWNGTNCLGLQYNPKLLTASMVHDFICERHYAVENDRQLSSMIFRELGIASGVNKPFMWLAYHCVDNFQKVFGRDLKGNKWE